MQSVGHVFCLLFLAVCSRAADWSYDEAAANGPDHWVDLYQACGGQNQSPVDFDSASAVPLPGYEAFALNNYDRISTTSFSVVNNGHSIQLTEPDGDVTVSGGGLGRTYTLEQFHFHWGPFDRLGSEHTIDGVAYAMEIHLVHYNQDLYANVKAAAGSGDPAAIAVLGVFVDVDETNPSDELGQIASSIAAVTYEGDTTVSAAFAMQQLLPLASLSDFYRYSGSLTTPGCSEVVQWTVFRQPLYISSAQLALFRTLHENIAGDPDVLLTDNYRPVQPINTRTLYKGPGVN